MRILHCAETVKGGVGSYIRNLLPLQLKDFGFDNVVLIVPSGYRSHLSVPDGVRLIEFSEGKNRLASSLALLKCVSVELSRDKFDVVHMHSTFAGAVVRPFLKIIRSKTRSVYCPHGWSFVRKTKGLSFLASVISERILSFFSDVIVCVSGSEKMEAVGAGISASKLVVVMNGVPDADFMSVIKSENIWPDDRRLKILFVGRFDRQKGVDVLLHAAAKLENEIFVVLVGGAVVESSDQFVFPSNARSDGWKGPDEILAYFAQADVLVAPSRWEGLPLVVLEAMRAALPVVVSNIEPMRECISDGVEGIFFEVDSVDGLASILNTLDTSSIRGMREAARARYVSSFSMDRLHRELLSVYYSE